MKNKDPNSKTALKKAEKKAEKEADAAFAKQVKARDNFSCVICQSNNQLNCHHLFPRERKDIRHELLNGITLCILHHKFSLEISPHKNAAEFFLWLMKNRPEQFKFIEENLKWGKK